MNLTDWLDYIEKLHPQWMDLQLDRVLDLAQRLNLTQFDCPVITIGGTNGKGSCVAFLEAIYSAAGYRVGAYISPHLLHFNERVRLQGVNASDQQLCQAFEFVESARGEIPLTYFEFTTLAALWLFKAQSLDVLILEIGLGGRKDAVNVVENDAAVVTSISLDHTQWLGSDREAIGGEKAAIFRKNKIAICGDQDIPSSVLQIAKQNQSFFYALEKDYHYQLKELSWEWRFGKTYYENLPLPKLPLQNAATSLAVIHLLNNKLPVDLKAISEGLKEAFMPGRFQVFHSPVLTILDVAHNPASSQLLAELLKRQASKGKTLAIVGMLIDKDISETIKPLITLVDHWFCGNLDCLRGAKAADISQCLQAFGLKRCYDSPSIEEAYKEALKHADPLMDRIVVFGSFYTVAAVMPLLVNHVEKSYSL